MNRRQIIRCFVCGLGLLSLTGASANEPGNQTEAEQPNVVLIMTDDQGYGDLACHGHPFLKTPNLDKLHGNSVRLTNYHVSPLCSPTRAALMTGRHCRHVGVSGTGGIEHLIIRGIPIVAEIFADNGYRTGAFGKWHLGSAYPYRPNDRGFHETLVHGAGAVSTIGDIWGNDYFDDTYWHNGKKEQFKGYCTDVWFDHARRFIKKSTDAGKPFFCYIPTNIVHGPYYAPKQFMDMYEGKPGNPAFFGAITHFDRCVGELRDFLQKQEIAENTIFIYATDNGGATGVKVFNAGMKGSKGSSYEGGHRVPFFIHWPREELTGGRDVDQLSAHIDVLPTLVDLCGLRTGPNHKTDGLSLKPVLAGTRDHLDERILVESFRGVVMTQRWRLVQNRPNRRTAPKNAKGLLTVATSELYDIQKDPGQQQNLADAHPKVVAQLRAELERVNQRNAEPDHRYVIGSDRHNPVEFTPDHWHGRKGLGWWQSGIIAGNGAPASIPVEVDRDGTYEFRLRRWPKAVNQPISSGADVRIPSNAYGGTKVVSGKALPVVKARLKMRDYDKTIDVTDNMLEAKFAVPLKKGKHEIHTEFLGNGGNRFGVHYLYVMRR